jgi:hypothetical protein
MTPRIACLSAALFLAGCSGLPSMHSLLTFDRDEEAAPAPMAQADAVAAPAPAPAAAQPDNWCNSVAANARAQAAANGFDAATQDRMTQNALRQCVAMNQN